MITSKPLGSASVTTTDSEPVRLLLWLALPLPAKLRSASTSAARNSSPLAVTAPPNRLGAPMAMEEFLPVLAVACFWALVCSLRITVITSPTWVARRSVNKANPWPGAKIAPAVGCAGVSCGTGGTASAGLGVEAQPARPNKAIAAANKGRRIMAITGCCSRRTASGPRWKWPWSSSRRRVGFRSCSPAPPPH